MTTNNIKLFDFKGNDVRAMADTDGNPYLAGYDTAKILGYRKPENAIARHCKAQITTLKQGGGYITMIPERDVYRLIMRSKLPEAEAFEEWVVGEVLPSIRKHGGYIRGQEEMSNEELLSKALQVAQSKIEEKNRKIAEDAPKVEQYEKLIGSDNLYNVSDLAKSLNLGPKKLARFMREQGILQKRTDCVMPKEPYGSNGFFDVKQVQLPDGSFKANGKLTPKGFEHFLRKYEELIL